MEITHDANDQYRVQSDSGSVYHITYAGCGDADPDYVALWECDCPAGRHGKDCKHITRFLEMMDAGEFEDSNN